MKTRNRSYKGRYIRCAGLDPIGRDGLVREQERLFMLSIVDRSEIMVIYVMHISWILVLRNKNQGAD